MKKNKCIYLLKSLKQIEFYKFGIFLNSNFLNKNKTIFKLYNILKKYYPEFDDPAITKENIYKTLFPGKFYKEKTIRNIYSELEKLLEKYMRCLNCGNNINSVLKDNLFLQELVCYLNKKNSKIYESLFNKKEKKIKLDLDNKLDMDREYFYKQYLLQKSVNQFYANKIDLNKKIDLSAELYFFDKYSILTKVYLELKILTVNNESPKVISLDLPKIFKHLAREYQNEYIIHLPVKKEC